MEMTRLMVGLPLLWFAAITALEPLPAQTRQTQVAPRQQRPRQQPPNRPQPAQPPAQQQPADDDSWVPALVVPVKNVGTLPDTQPAARRGVTCAQAGIVLTVFGPHSPPGPTAEASPRLFWYVSETLDPECQVTFTLMCDPQDPENASAACPEGTPPVEVPVSGLIRPGIHEVKPAPQLQSGVLYRWYISVGRKEDGRSGDDLAGAFIRRDPQGASKPWYDRLPDAFDRARKGDRGDLYRLLLEVGFEPAVP